ncbi:hypothetical protein HYH03_011185 [Edaphochlamys debaryana]|uniref:Uncharacterized protein n=1 Tax=Edaphochlamys debaryana TaxID=47281 RepID=A0A835Y3H6_9CHLO|nr:hypothetical protein HYH03_011185 [Edaphochlamys debaryana]|eukprot:KAG2490384.1 hypothetical protein HYH03_011185 [Edaphochlamys debaryana]
MEKSREVEGSADAVAKSLPEDRLARSLDDLIEQEQRRPSQAVVNGRTIVGRAPRATARASYSEEESNGARQPRDSAPPPPRNRSTRVERRDTADRERSRSRERSSAAAGGEQWRAERRARRAARAAARPPAYEPSRPFNCQRDPSGRVLEYTLTGCPVHGANASHTTEECYEICVARNMYLASRGLPTEPLPRRPNQSIEEYRALYD